MNKKIFLIKGTVFHIELPQDFDDETFNDVKNMNVKELLEFVMPSVIKPTKSELFEFSNSQPHILFHIVQKMKEINILNVTINQKESKESLLVELNKRDYIECIPIDDLKEILEKFKYFTIVRENETYEILSIILSDGTLVQIMNGMQRWCAFLKLNNKVEFECCLHRVGKPAVVNTPDGDDEYWEKGIKIE